MDIDKVVGDRLAADNDFHSRIANLPDEEKATETEKRRKEIMNDEFAKAHTIGSDQRKRAEKAEEDLKKLTPPSPKPDAGKEDTLTSTDLYALTSSQVHPDDVAEVQKARKILTVDGKVPTIAEVLADPVFAPILASRVEKRKTANATSTDPKRPSATGKTDAEILDDVTKRGVIPEPGTPEAEAVFRARRNKNKK